MIVCALSRFVCGTILCFVCVRLMFPAWLGMYGFVLGIGMSLFLSCYCILYVLLLFVFYFYHAYACIHTRSDQNIYYMKPEFYKKIEKEAESLLALSNASETEVMKQILFLDSGALALLGAFAATSGDASTVQSVLVTVLVGLLIISLSSAIIHLLLSHILFRNAHTLLEDSIKLTRKMKTEEQAKFYTERVISMKRSSSSLPFWFSVITFVLGVLILSALIITNIW